MGLYRRHRCRSMTYIYSEKHSSGKSSSTLVSPNVPTGSREVKNCIPSFSFLPMQYFVSYQGTLSDTLADRESCIFAANPPYVILYNVYPSVQRCTPRVMIGHLTTSLYKDSGEDQYRLDFLLTIHCRTSNKVYFLLRLGVILIRHPDPCIQRRIF